jgi:hypothetical protein
LQLDNWSKAVLLETAAVPLLSCKKSNLNTEYDPPTRTISTFKMANAKKTGYRILISGLVILIFVAPIAILIVMGMSAFFGEEFSPDDFSRRSFSYVQVPYLKLTIIGKSYEDTTPALEQVMVSDGLIPSVKKIPKTWHLIQDSGSTVDGYPSFECDARILVDYLDLVDTEGNSCWESWNQEYPESAKIFWPLVAEMARDEMYLAIPGIMRLALEIERDEPGEFEDRLTQIAAADYLQFGIIDQKKKRLRRALVRLTKSTEMDPSTDADRHRDEVLKQLGKTDNTESNRPSAVEMLPEKEPSD